MQPGHLETAAEQPAYEIDADIYSSACILPDIHTPFLVSDDHQGRGRATPLVTRTGANRSSTLRTFVRRRLPLYRCASRPPGPGWSEDPQVARDRGPRWSNRPQSRPDVISARAPGWSTV